MASVIIMHGYCGFAVMLLLGTKYIYIYSGLIFIGLKLF